VELIEWLALYPPDVPVGNAVFMRSQIGGISDSMQDAVYILERSFETSLYITGFIYIFLWIDGRKPTNGQTLFAFGVSCAIAFFLTILNSIFSTYILLIGCSTLLLLRQLRTLLNAKPSSQAKFDVYRKPSELPAKSELRDYMSSSRDGVRF
jgi:hypothetical protein